MALAKKERAPTQDQLNQLIALYNARQYLQVEINSSALVDLYPESGSVWKIWGVTLLTQGKDALFALQKAVQLLPDDAASHFNLGNALKALGQLEKAVASYRRALKIKTDYAEAYCNLGASLRDMTRFEEAVTSYRRALAIKPVYPRVYSNLGLTLHDLGQFEEAAANSRRAIEIKPDYSEAHNNLGLALKGMGKLADAEVSFKSALALKPDFTEAYSNLGNTQIKLGQLDDALASFTRILEIRPDNAQAYNSAGIVFRLLGKYKVAIESYRRALEIHPNYAEAHNNLGTVLSEFGQDEAAVESFKRALEINPEYAEANSNLGAALQRLGRVDIAVQCYLRSIEINPGFADAQFNLGNVQLELGRFDDAVSSINRAIEIKPDYMEALSILLYSNHYISTGVSPYQLEPALQFGKLLASKVSAKYSSWQCEEKPVRLRVGIVSGDLLDHPVGYFLEGLLSHIDTAHIELIAYPTRQIEDDLSARIRPYFTKWRTLFGRSDEVVAGMIHEDGVHVLLDLSGHTAHNCLPAFSWKPAPVQASWLGYFGTTGVAEMDYVLVDEVGVPQTQQDQFTEKVWYLPDTRLCFTQPQVDLAVEALPSLSNGYITFGCFQKLNKVNDEVIKVWSEILAAIPGAKLRMQCRLLEEPVHVEQLHNRMQRYGIAPGQVQTFGAVSREDYLAAHAKVDVMLDTFPYPGGTTTCEALWMGVPTLTLAGDRILSRQGASLLAAAGLPDWVAESREDYINKAIALAGDLQKLSALRIGLRQQVLASPVFDGKRFARNLEEALWGMWGNFISKKCSEDET